MANTILPKLYLLIIAYIGWGLYQDYEVIEEKKAELLTQEIASNAKLKKLGTQREKIKEYFSDIDAAKERIEKANLQIEELQKKFPSEISTTADLDFFTQIATSLKMKEVRPQLQSEISKDFYFEQRYFLSTRGTYLQNLIFLEKVAQAERLYNIDSITLNVANEQKMGRFQVISSDIVLVGYRYNKNYKPPPPPEIPEKKNKKAKKVKKGVRGNSG